MKTAAVLLLGAALAIAATKWARPTVWLLTRIPPVTPPEHQPRYRTWHHGVEVTGNEQAAA